MTGLADWETEGAKPRAASPADDVPAPAGLRALTLIGVLLLVAAGFTLLTAAFLTQDGSESTGHFVVRVDTTVLAGMAAAVVGALSLVLRLVTGTILRAVEAAR